ncbi:N-ethylmaleimide reductase [Silvibacterium bohemicum]|uniref:N-ethylmaleimide reductase n=1 Tax=Silvibacterium bohemicum TaxID=1577686 RepID=A0A841JTG7_9BACT|nr:alkene reductase [Silvibacterium bohemicum]MBB6143795.1 N-ethylmaleimide reductase [Silvibacterium bohemicum]
MSKHTTELLLSHYTLGDLDLPNRIVMAPLTRSRAAEGGVPTPLMAEYYAQRASAGLIIAEATQISAEGRGYDGTPGIYTEAQIAGWELVTHAVHTCGGRIFLQLWHVGRISHTSLQPDNRAPVAPSAIPAKAQTFIDGRFVEVSEPRALERNEIREIVDAYVLATRNALWAGFDGVEVHAANGYLIDQFLRDGSNERTDEYGGSIENRTRFLTEVMQGVIEEASEDCVGVRISPVSSVNDAHDSNPTELFSDVVKVLDRLKPVYLHVIEGQTNGPRDIDPSFDFHALRQKFHRTYMANNGYTLELAAQCIEAGDANLVAFGGPFIANPDLVERFRANEPLNAPDPATFYGGGARGYTDYPAIGNLSCSVGSSS